MDTSSGFKVITFIYEAKPVNTQRTKENEMADQKLARLTMEKVNLHFIVTCV